MGDTVTCPNCTMENAYFNGVQYECPDCDGIWNAEQDDEEQNIDEENS